MREEKREGKRKGVVQGERERRVLIMVSSVHCPKYENN